MWTELLIPHIRTVYDPTDETHRQLSPANSTNISANECELADAVSSHPSLDRRPSFADNRVRSRRTRIPVSIYNSHLSLFRLFPLCIKVLAQFRCRDSYSSFVHTRYCELGPLYTPNRDMKEAVITPKLLFLLPFAWMRKSSIERLHPIFTIFEVWLPSSDLSLNVNPYINALLNDHLFYFFPSKQCVRVLNTAPSILY